MAAITVCVPVFNGAAFVHETLDSIAAQSFSDIKVLISVDCSEDDSERICRRYLADNRFELIVQSERLGWVRNANALIERVATPWFCIIPHDDILNPRYLAEVHALAASDPSISCVYCDLEAFGGRQGVIVQPDIRGPTLQRVLGFLLNHFGAVAFRGIVRRQSAEDRPYLLTTLSGDFAEDTVWMFKLALRGELRRVPATLYRKRYLQSSVHAQWSQRSREELNRLWAEQAAFCARMALEVIPDPGERELVIAAALIRAAGIGDFPGLFIPRSRFAIAAASARFCECLHDIGPLPDMQSVLARPAAKLLREAIARRESSKRPVSLAKRLQRRFGKLLGR